MNRTLWACVTGCSIASAGCTERVTPDHLDDAFVVPRDTGHDIGPIPDVWPPPDNTCQAIHVETMRIVPRVVVVIDRSGSMIMDFGGVSRWSALETALIGTDGLVTRLSAAVRFGGAMYTWGPEDPSCPTLDTVPVALPGLSNIRSLYSGRGPDGNTPTGEALALVLASRADLFDEAHQTGPEIMILATDGEPGPCRLDPDGGTYPDGGGADAGTLDGPGQLATGRMLSVQAASDAHDAGIDTYVISVGTEVANTHLQDVANAGVGHVAGAPDAPFWVATDTSELSTALATIASSALPCTLELMSSIHPDRACEGTLLLGATPLACGTDWHADDATHITLGTDACAQLRSSTDDLLLTFPCDVVVF